jgi:hypothetical protein
MSLDTVQGIVGEQGRIYRLTCNGHLKPSDMCRMMFGLREIRASIEAANAAETAAAAAATVIQHEAPFGVNIVSIPDNYYHHADGSFRPLSSDMLQIAHAPELPASLEPQPDVPQLTALEAKLIAMDHAQLLELAEALNVGK